MIKSIHTFISALPNTQSAEMAGKQFQQTVESLGFERFALTLYNDEFSPEHSKQDVVAPSLFAWHQHFHQQNYDIIDDIAMDVKQINRPILWDLSSQQATCHTEMRQMVSEALDYGLSAGISLTIPNRRQQSILVLHQAQSAAIYASNPQLILTIQAMAAMYCEHIHYLNKPSLLSSRERQILQLSVHFSAKAIARQIHRSERTVIFHMDNIKNKLGVKTKTEAIYQGMKRGLIG